MIIQGIDTRVSVICHASRCKYNRELKCRYKSILIREDGCCQDIEHKAYVDTETGANLIQNNDFESYTHPRAWAPVDCNTEDCEPNKKIKQIRNAVMEYYNDTTPGALHSAVLKANGDLCYKVQEILGMSWTR